jgi:hypothetical protein
MQMRTDGSRTHACTQSNDSASIYHQSFHMVQTSYCDPPPAAVGPVQLIGLSLLTSLQLTALGLRCSCRWYGSHAITINETNSATDTVLQLAAALRQPPEPITAAEQAAIREKFSWGTIVPAFYKRIEQELRCRPCRPQHLHQSVEGVMQSVMTDAEFEAHVKQTRMHGLLAHLWPAGNLWPGAAHREHDHQGGGADRTIL